MTHNLLVYPSTLPGEPFERYSVMGMTLEQWLHSNVPSFRAGPEQPISATVNGMVVPPEQWSSTWISAESCVELRSEPKDPATMIIAAVVAVVAVAATYMLMPSMHGQNSKTSRGSSIYEANAQGNAPKLGDVIPEIAGRHKTFPDYLTAPRRYFIDKKNQALDMLLCVGKGEYDIPEEGIKIGSTPIGNLGGDVAYTLYPPGANVTGHIAHRRWFNAPEVGASTGSSGLRLKGIDDKIFEGSLVTSGDLINFEQPGGWLSGMRAQINLRQMITITDGGAATTATDVVTAVDTSDESGAVVTGVEVTKDAEGNITDVTSTNGTALSGITSTVQTATIEVNQALPDILAGDFTGLAPGMRVRIKGADIGGVYLVATLDGGSMTLSTLGGAAVTDLPEGSYQASIDMDGATYEFIELLGEQESMRVARRLPSGDLDTTWSALPASSYGRIAISDTNGIWCGPFLGCPEGEATSRIEWDIFAPQGLGHINDDGDIEERSRTVELQYRPLGGSDWVAVQQTITGQSRDQMGWTFTVDIAEMTPEIRVRRNSVESDSTQALDRIEWYGLRSELPAKSSYPGVTTMALTLTGSDTIANQTENQVSVVATRRLPVRSGGGWQAAVATRNIAPWVAYVAKSVGYTDAEIDYDELDRLDATWQARGDYYDFVTDDDSTVKESLKRALRAGMAELTIDAGRLRPVRDEPRSTFEHGYSPQNMLGPLKRRAQAPRPDDADGVDVEYFSGDTWTKETVECRLPGDNGFKAEKLRLDGVTSRTRAWRIGMRERRRMKYRRWSYSFETELDALNSRYMSYCALLDDVPGYGQSALIEDIDGDVIRSSEPLEWVDGESHVIAWRRPSGTLAGPYAATRGDDDYHVIASMPEVPEIDRRGELPHLYFGTLDEWSFPTLITDIKPQGFESVSVTATNYDSQIYTDDNNAPS